MNQQQPAGHAQNFKGFMNWLVFACRALACSVEVFLHKGNTIGVRYLGLQAVAAALVLFLWPAFFGGNDCGGIIYFFFVFLGSCVVIRIRGLVQQARGGKALEHSYYSGRPWLMGIAGSLSEAKVKSAAEPLLVFIVAMIALSDSYPLGCYLIFAGIGLLVSTNLSIGFDKTRALDMNDAMLDQRRIAEQWREIRHD